MATGFRNTARGIAGSLPSAERALLGKLFGDVIELLTGRQEVHALDDEVDPLYALTGMRPSDAQLPVPSDPAVHRLLPDASQDPEVAAEFRRLTEADLLSEKLGRLREGQLLLESEKVLFGDTAQATRFAQALNDVRLVLATRLDIEDEADAERIGQILDAAEVQTQEDYLALVYNLVSWLQDSLMSALLNEQA
ncbi:DUF2017 domain-containing protein [Glutamicibacter endophyticus]|uniref:DUF2017 domain-containing protein n=1 Tax=Glutamicibacter endophyticus TaxID=1522174 RepID=UPI003AEFB44D